MLRERTRPGAGDHRTLFAEAVPPSGPGWIHEIKHDGFRILARRDAVGVRLYTRNGYDCAASSAAY
jgi:ATP-dependent DNA ligase